VPVFVTPHLPQPLLESGAIVSHIIQRYDTAHKFSFAPGTAEEALQTQWLYFISSTLYSNQVGAYVLAFHAPVASPKENTDFFRKQIKTDWEYVESQLVNEKKRLGLGENETAYLVGGKYSVADIVAWAQLVCVDWMCTVEWKTWGLKEVERWAATISEREAVKKGYFALQEKAQ
jgi:glutathione S-transferase